MSESKKIEVVPYTELWKTQFSELKETLIHSISTDEIQIEHVGSTAVPGLMAKPVIDVDIIVEDEKTLQVVLEDLKKIGYRHLGNRGITGREAFERRDDSIPYTSPKRVWFKHHLYLCLSNSLGLKNHLILRDYLLNNPNKVEEYSKLKMDLAQKFPNDIDAYVDGKTDFIVAILNEMGMNTSETKTISKENKLK